jgi:hypothetical protein
VPGARADARLCGYKAVTSADRSAALVRCRVTSHGLSLRLERGARVSAGLLHFRRLFPAGGIATPAAQQASAKCSSAADTPAAALRRRIVTRRRTARRGPARRSGVRRSEPPRHIVPRRTTRDISRKHPCPQPHRPSCLATSSSRTGLPGPATSACRTEPRWRGRARRSRARAWRPIRGSTPWRWWRAGPARRGPGPRRVSCRRRP